MKGKYKRTRHYLKRPKNTDSYAVHAKRRITSGGEKADFTCWKGRKAFDVLGSLADENRE